MTTNQAAVSKCSLTCGCKDSVRIRGGGGRADGMGHTVTEVSRTIFFHTGFCKEFFYFLIFGHQLQKPKIIAHMTHSLVYSICWFAMARH